MLASDSFSFDKVAIQSSTAAKTYSKSQEAGVEVGKGEEKNRLQFTVPQGDQNRVIAQVYVETIGEGFFQALKSQILSWATSYFIKHEHNGRTIYININSLSKRLGISKADIQRINSQGGNKELSHNIELKYRELCRVEDKIEAQFQDIVSNCNQRNYKESSDVPRGFLKKPYLRNLIGISVIHGASLDNGDQKGVVLKSRKMLHIRKLDADKYSELTLFTREVLGAGADGEVRVVNELSKARRSIAKLVMDQTQMLRANLEKEKQLVSKIHRGEQKAGIQQGIHQDFDFEVEGEVYTGYFASKYEGDLFDFIGNLKPEEKIECARQLLQGLAELEELKIVHGDLKTNNCLIRHVDGKIECVLADFGRAQDISKKVEYVDRDERYAVSRDRLEFLRFAKNFPKATIEQKITLENKGREISLKADVYAMGLIMEELLGYEAKTLIANMQKERYEERLTATEALKAFNEIYSTNL